MLNLPHRQEFDLVLGVKKASLRNWQMSFPLKDEQEL